MIEKIMRAVKSNNKKRGRNVTIGAVVGILLSCSAVMRADVVGLEITKDGDTIIFKDKDGTPFIPGKEKDPYLNNEWDGNTYINNSIIIGETTSGDNVIGLKLSDNLKVNLTNNGVITGSGSGSGSGYGIDISNLTGNLTNNGIITGSGSSSGYDSGISMSTLTGNLTNTGVVYGKTNAIQIANTDTTKSAYNYGILVTDGSKAVEGLGKKLTSYGLIIKNANDGSVTVEAGDVVTGPIDVIVGYKRTVENGIVKDIEIKRKLTIKNAKITNGTESAEGVITGNRTESFKFSGGGTEYDNSILNGMDDTLEISEADVDREVKGSLINAYGNAVKFGEVGKEFTLSGTIVNGGIKSDTVAIKGSNGADTLILQSGKVEYSDKTTGSQNTIVNGDIDMGCRNRYDLR